MRNWQICFEKERYRSLIDQYRSFLLRRHLTHPLPLSLNGGKLHLHFLVIGNIIAVGEWAKQEEHSCAGLASVQLQIFVLETELRNCYNLSKPTCARQAGVPPRHKSLAGA